MDPYARTGDEITRARTQPTEPASRYMDKRSRVASLLCVCVACGLLLGTLLCLYTWLTCRSHMAQMDACRGASEAACPGLCGCFYCRTHGTCASISDAGYSPASCASLANETSACGVARNRVDTQACVYGAAVAGSVLLLVDVLTISTCIVAVIFLVANSRAGIALLRSAGPPP